MSEKVGIVILAAGQGTRMKINRPKPLVPLLGKCLIDFPIKESLKFLKSKGLEGSLNIVLGHKKEDVEKHLKNSYKETEEEFNYVFQKEQKGTADALISYFNSSENALKNTYTLVECADTPLIEEKDLILLYDKLQNDNLCGIAATFETKNPTGYGRILNSSKGFRIVEEKEATAKEREIEEVNSGLYIFKTSFILEYLEKINNSNSTSEFYLTDLFQMGLNVDTYNFGCVERFVGINDIFQLEKVESQLRTKENNRHKENGVRFIDSSTAYIDMDVEIGAGTTVYPNVLIEGKTEIGEGVMIEPGVVIKNSTIKDFSQIRAYSYLESCIISDTASIGPFARIRPMAIIGAKSKIGNFVEIKKSTLGVGSKVSHLSYIGDAEIGDDTNIGCGFITCNYDGKNKHKTIIGKGSFIGSDSQTVAPVTIGDECFVASGSTINEDMPDGSFAISRGKQVTKDKMAKRFLKK